MEEIRGGVSPRVLSRIGGALYLIVIAGGVFGEAFIRSRLVVGGDAAATAANIRSFAGLWRAGIALEVFMLTCALTLAVIFFVLLRPVSRDLALLATFFNLVSIGLEAANELQLVAAMLPLEDAGVLAAFEPGQVEAMAGLALRRYAHGFGVSLIFFGWMCVVLGSLIFRSGFVPKSIGALMQIAGACYLTNSFALLLAPDLAARLFPAILLPAFVAESALCLWLLIRGVDPREWPVGEAPGPRPGSGG